MASAYHKPRWPSAAAVVLLLGVMLGVQQTLWQGFVVVESGSVWVIERHAIITCQVKTQWQHPDSARVHPTYCIVVLYCS